MSKGRSLRIKPRHLAAHTLRWGTLTKREGRGLRGLGFEDESVSGERISVGVDLKTDIDANAVDSEEIRQKELPSQYHEPEHSTEVAILNLPDTLHPVHPQPVPRHYVLSPYPVQQNTAGYPHIYEVLIVPSSLPCPGVLTPVLNTDLLEAGPILHHQHQPFLYPAATICLTLF